MLTRETPYPIANGKYTAEHLEFSHVGLYDPTNGKLDLVYSFFTNSTYAATQDAIPEFQITLKMDNNDSTIPDVLLDISTLNSAAEVTTASEQAFLTVVSDTTYTDITNLGVDEATGTIKKAHTPCWDFPTFVSYQILLGTWA